MTIKDFDELLSKVEIAVIENGNHKTALIYLHKILYLVENAAEYTRIAADCPRLMKAPLADIRHKAHLQGAQVLGFIQQLAREEQTQAGQALRRTRGR